MIPRCSKCRRIGVLDPCRRCASPAQLEAYPEEPSDHEYLQHRPRPPQEPRETPTPAPLASAKAALDRTRPMEDRPIGEP